MARSKASVLSLRVGFYDYPHNREALSTKDSYFKNCFPEKVEGGTQETTKYEIVKRPGLGEAKYDTTAGVGRGMYIWEGDIYHVVGTAVYKNGSALTVTLSTSTGKVYWEQMGGSSASKKLLLLAGEDVYTIVAAGTVTIHSGGTQANAQIATVSGGIASLDGYAFVCDTDGKILHNNTQNDTAANMSWSNANIISANVYSDSMAGVCRHLNYIVGIGDWSTEFFYNAGNTSGSILSRAEGTVIRYGTPAFATVWQDENLIVWLARSRDGGNCVMVLDGLTPKIVSTKPIERILNASKVTDAVGYGIRLAGHIFYVLSLPTADKTLVFSLTDNMWHEWTSYESSVEGYFKIQEMKGYISSTGILEVVALHVSDGNVYTFAVGNYEDNGNGIKVKIVTDKVDFQTNQRKFLAQLRLLSNLVDHSSEVSVALRYTDDDYKSWTSADTKDMRYIPAWSALGSFNRRAFEFTYEANFAFRVEGFEFGIRLGAYAQARR